VVTGMGPGQGVPMPINIDENEINRAGIGVQLGVSSDVDISVKKNKMQDVGVGVSVIDTSNWNKVGIPADAPPQAVVQFFTALKAQGDLTENAVKKTLEDSNLGRWLNDGVKVTSIVSNIASAIAAGVPLF
jgi:hypothetical protein